MTAGEGGLVITNDKDLFTKASEYHDHGHDHNPSGREDLRNGAFIGVNFRMSELQGAVALAQFRKLESVILPAQRKNRRDQRKLLRK